MRLRVGLNKRPMFKKTCKLSPCSLPLLGGIRVAPALFDLWIVLQMPSVVYLRLQATYE